MRLSIVLCVILVATCSPAVLAAFDFVITDTYDHGTVELNNESLLVVGAGAYQVWARGLSYVEVQGTGVLQTDVGGINALDLDDNSSMRLYGGELGGIYLYKDATAALEGGSINSIHSFQNVFDVIVGWDDDGNPIYNTHIELISKAYAYNPATTTLTGTWADDSTFNIQLLNQTGWDPVIDNIKFTIIPEPATLLLIGVGGLLLRRTRGGY